jgi:hypothetical protein
MGPNVALDDAAPETGEVVKTSFFAGPGVLVRLKFAGVESPETLAVTV